MKSIVFVIALLWATVANAQLTATGFGGGFGGGAAAYTGPGDIVSFSGWWGLRAYSSAKRGTKAISLCDNAGANCADVLTNATTGALNSPGTRGANNCNTSGTCLIATFYDQTSNANDCTQATTANMAALNMTSGPGGNTPAALFNAASTINYSCVSATVSFPVSQSAVAERTGATGAFGTVISYGSQDDLGFNSSVNSAYIYAGGGVISVAANDNVWHAMQGLYLGTASDTISIDGVSNSGSAGSNNPFGGATLIGRGIGGYFTGSMSEAGTIASNASANFSALNSNQHSFWGF